MINLSNGILIPRGAIKEKIGVRCGFCPKVIYRDEEAKGRLFVISGKPVCARCRILKGKFGKLIRKDHKKFEEDVELKGKVGQERANRKVRELAYETQRATKTRTRRRKQ